jgi:hypothetical protein
MNPKYLVITALLAVHFLPGYLSAQEWARKMFSESTHDFGVVAAGSQAIHRFEFKNLFKEDIHVASVRSSCGCTTPSIERQDLKTYETSAIVAKFNTETFRGQKQATLTVLIDRPYRAEVQLIVRGNIQGNVSFEPGSVQFGDIMVGSSANRSVKMSQRGNPGWQIVDIKTTFDDEKIKVRLRETGRVNGLVSYDINVELQGSLEPGYINGELFVETNEGLRYPLNFSGRVAPPLEISPQVLALAPLSPGQVVKRRILLKAEVPFRVTNIETSGPEMTLEAEDKLDRLQVIEVTYHAGTATGRHESRATITTNLGSTMTARLTTLALIESGDQVSR